jgi:hypothetical protein
MRCLRGEACVSCQADDRCRGSLEVTFAVTVTDGGVDASASP